MDGSGLTGSYRVRMIRPVIGEERKLCDRPRQLKELRRQELKLRYWPVNNPIDHAGTLLDLDWSWIRALPGLQVGELRIHDSINGHDNLRVVFFVGDPQVCKPLPMIWILAVFQKKRNEFTAGQLSVFRTRRLLVLERFYGKNG